MEINIREDKIVSCKPSNDPPSGNTYIGPGLVDLQVNGFAGVDFNSFPISEGEFAKAVSALAKGGVTTFLPTIITNSDTKIINLLENIDKLCKDNPLIGQFIGGIHLEGPFISPCDGARGAHDKTFVKAPDWELFRQFQAASGHRIKILTLSPEWGNSAPFIEKCVNHGVTVAIGHSVATPEQIKTAVDAGASMSTHLGNGATLELPRNSNIVIEQLSINNVAAGLIADGFHLPESFLKIALKIKESNAFIVSDSTMFAGMKSAAYHSHIGGDVILSPDGRLSLAGNHKLLAGAALPILHGVKHLLNKDIVPLSKAWALASVYPQKFIKLKPQNKDLVIFEMNDTQISIVSVYKSGKKITEGSLS